MPTWSLTNDEAKIINEMHKESDRAAAIIAGSLLEDRIELMIRAHCRVHKDAYSGLFGVARPLNSFAAKNNLALLLRCYGSKLHYELDIINKIRNRFAHYLSDKGDEIRDFQSPAINNLCSNLKIVESYVRPMEDWEERDKAIPIEKRIRGMLYSTARETILENNRERFLTTAGLFSVYLGIYPKPSDYIQLMGDEPKPPLVLTHELY
jgi:hypothetical protein